MLSLDMADQCTLCNTRRPEGGTNHLILNGGSLWIEFCGPCGEKETLTNGETGEVATIREIFDTATKEKDKERS